MNRLGKTVELIVKLETIYDEEAKSQALKLKGSTRDKGSRSRTRSLRCGVGRNTTRHCRFQKKIAPVLCLHACPHCGDEMDPRGSSVIEDISDYKFVCWECEEEFHVDLATTIAERLENPETWIKTIQNEALEIRRFTAHQGECRCHCRLMIQEIKPRVPQPPK